MKPRSSIKLPKSRGTARASTSQPRSALAAAEAEQPKVAETDLLKRFNCGPIQFTGGHNALYERHLTFDGIVPTGAALPRDKFEAIARSIRDVLSQRWLKTEQT